MPGVYAKPPTREAFAKEINYMLQILKKKEAEKKWRDIMEVCVPMIMDEFAVERRKAREEAKKEYDRQMSKCRRDAQQNAALNHNTATNAETHAQQVYPHTASDSQSEGFGSSAQATHVAAAAEPAAMPQQCDGSSALSLGDLEARKERDVAEVFFVEGVHSAFCRILQISSKEPEIEDVMPILMEYERLLLVEIDPYDIDMSPLPLLIYFLSERHHFYVDIHWHHHELSLMETFLLALISVIEPAGRTLTNDSVAIKSMTAAPPNSNSSPVCADGTQPINAPKLATGSGSANSTGSCNHHSELPTSEETAEGKLPRPHEASTSHSGLSSAAEADPQECVSARQSEMVHATAIKLLYRTLFIFPPHRVVSRMATVFGAARCRTIINAMSSTPAFWESGKGLAQIAHTLAALTLFGLGAPMAAAVVPASLLWVAASNLIRETRCPCSSCELQRRLLKACRMRDEVGVQAAAQDKRQIVHCLVRAGAPRLLTQLFEGLAKRQKAALEEATDKSADGIKEDQISYVDQALQFSSWALLLCSWSYEEMHGRDSLLAFDNAALLVSILACIPVTHGIFLSSLTAHQRPGAASLLCVTLYLLLKAPPGSRNVLLQKAYDVFYPLAIHTAEFVATRDPYSRARDVHAPLKAALKNSQGPPKASADAGGKGMDFKALDLKVKTEASESTQIIFPQTAKQHGPPTPTVDVLLLAPVVMGLYQSLLCSENQALFMAQRETPNRLEMTGAGALSTATEVVIPPGNAAAAAAVAPDTCAIVSVPDSVPSVLAVTAIQQPAGPADLAAGAPVRAVLPHTSKSPQLHFKLVEEAGVTATAAYARSAGQIASGVQAEMSLETPAPLAPASCHRLLSVGIAACEAFIHIYEYVNPLLASWENLGSRQDFTVSESGHTRLRSNVVPSKEPLERTSIAPFVSLEAVKEPTPAPIKFPFLPSRVCLAPCLNTSAAGFDYRAFYYAVVSCMLTLVGGMRLQALPQNRWRFAENPAVLAGGTAAVGGLASAARQITEFQKRVSSQGKLLVFSAVTELAPPPIVV